MIQKYIHIYGYNWCRGSNLTSMNLGNKQIDLLPFTLSVSLPTRSFHIGPRAIYSLLRALPSSGPHNLKTILGLVPIKYSLHSCPLAPRYAPPARSCCCWFASYSVDSNDIKICVIRSCWTSGLSNISN